MCPPLALRGPRPDDADAQEQHVQLAAEAVTEHGVQEGGDERGARGDRHRERNPEHVQHDADKRHREAHPLRERRRGRVLGLSRRGEPRADDGGEDAPVRVPLDTRERAPREERRERDKQQEARLGEPFSERRRGRRDKSEEDRDQEQHGGDGRPEPWPARVDANLCRHDAPSSGDDAWRKGFQAAVDAVPKG